jgi:hypothetical protein
MDLIKDDEILLLKKMKIKKLNLNYLIKFNFLFIDDYITPLICAIYLGKLEIV